MEAALSGPWPRWVDERSKLQLWARSRCVGSSTSCDVINFIRSTPKILIIRRDDETCSVLTSVFHSPQLVVHAVPADRILHNPQGIKANTLGVHRLDGHHFPECSAAWSEFDPKIHLLRKRRKFMHKQKSLEIFKSVKTLKVASQLKAQSHPACWTDDWCWKKCSNQCKKSKNKRPMRDLNPRP